MRALGIAVVIMIFGCSSGIITTNDPIDATPAPEEPAETSFRTNLINAVNEVRRSGCRCGNQNYAPAPALRWNDKLATAAQRHANDMAQRKFFSHKGSDGSDFAARVTAAGYQWAMVAENIAQGYGSVSAVVTGWKNSPGHCANMMNPNYTEMGGAERSDYWVQTLAKPMN